MKLTDFFKKFDMLAIAIVLTLAAASAVPMLVRADGAEICVTAGGERYSLPFADGEHVIASGGVTLVLEVSDGAARVVSSDCPDGLCMAMPAISRSGGTIVCVPAEVVISAGSMERGLDGVAG